jgi:hypothetical protein
MSIRSFSSVAKLITRWSGALDGQENDLPLHLLRNGVDQNLAGGLTVEGPLKVDAFYDKSWIINGINISKLLDGTIKTDQPANLTSFSFGTFAAIKFR